MPDEEIERCRELAIRHFDGALSDEGTAELNRLLRSSSQCRDEFTRYCLRLSMLHEMRASEVQASRLSFPRAKRRSRVWMALAASVLLLVVPLAVWKSSPPLSPTATVRTSGGELRVRRSDGEATPVQGSAELHAGDSVEVAGDRSLTTLVFEDGSQMTLLGSSRLRFDADKSETIFVSHGTMLASVAPRTSERTLKVITPTAEIRVLGTRFDLQTSAMQTELAVTEGAVEVTQSSSGKTIELTRGRHTRIAAESELIVDDTPAPPDRWELDFDDGLPGNWYGHFVSENLPSGSRGGSKAKLATEHGRRYYVGVHKAALRGLFAIHERSHLRVTFAMEDPSWINVFLMTRRQGIGGLYKCTAIANGLPAAGQWWTMTIPLSHFYKRLESDGDDWSGPSPRSDELPIYVWFSSTEPDRGFTIDHVSITPDGPGTVITRDIRDGD